MEIEDFKKSPTHQLEYMWKFYIIWSFLIVVKSKVKQLKCCNAENVHQSFKAEMFNITTQQVEWANYTTTKHSIIKQILL